MGKIIIIGLLLAAPVFAETPQDFVKTGNAAYAEGKFSDAVQKYQSAADSGFKSWVLEYNLGNAYYRAGLLGKSILHYERAFHMNSSQGDVRYNLNLATTKAGEPEFSSSVLPIFAWQLFYGLTINALTLFCSFFLLFFIAIAGFALAGRRIINPDAVIAVGFLFIILAGWTGIRIYLLEKPEGVVVSSVAEVRSGPNLTYPANFTVPEGRRVLLLQEQEPIQGWLEVGVPQEGLKGWVPDTSIEAI